MFGYSMVFVVGLAVVGWVVVVIGETLEVEEKGLLFDLKVLGCIVFAEIVDFEG